MKFEEMIRDKEAVEGVIEWLKSQELTVNVGPVQSEHDEYIESSAGWLLRLLQNLPEEGVALAGVEWKDYLAISEDSTVDLCIRNLIEDSTEDNAVCTVRAILAAFQRMKQL